MNTGAICHYQETTDVNTMKRYVRDTATNSINIFKRKRKKRKGRR